MTSALARVPQTSVATMRSAVLREPEAFGFRELPRPEPAAHQVRIRIEGCGVCGSNLPAWQGRPWFDYPLEPGAPGHEAWGTIDAVGEAVENLRIGDRVACLSYRGFAPFDLADADATIALPAALADQPFPGEPLACAVNVWRRSAIQPGETVAVVGIGFLGALLVQLATAAGARVLAVSRRRFALNVARECGAEQVYGCDKPRLVIEQIRRRTAEDGCDCVIEATGLQPVLDLASELVRVRGRLVIAGYHQDGPRQVNLQSWNWNGIDVINAHERDPLQYVDGMRQAIDAVAAGRLRIAPLLTHLFAADEINQAFRVASERPNGFLKSLVMFDG